MTGITTGLANSTRYFAVNQYGVGQRERERRRFSGPGRHHPYWHHLRDEQRTGKREDANVHRTGQRGRHVDDLHHL